MLSILIPTYNYNSAPLVTEIKKQCIGCEIEFEILVFDDGSKSNLNIKNNIINTFHNCTFRELPHNIGRGAIRNLLANNAKYNSLLFIDAGTFPKKENFIQLYLNSKNDVVNGGMTFTETPPKKPFKLRWVYTKHRETKAICASNFLISKAVFTKHPFNESIKNYGYEDVLFFQTLEKHNFKVLKINNPVIHANDDDANTFLAKTEFAITNLISLINNNKLDKKNLKIPLYHRKLENLKLTTLIAKLFNAIKPILAINFNSSFPSLILFDFYRLGYFCTLKNEDK